MAAEFDREKFKDAMHYVVALAGDHPGFGATKIYKVLWFAEGQIFMLQGRCIYNAEFVREKFGPVPRLAMPIRQELSKEGRVRIWQDRYHNRMQWRFKSLRRPDTRRFSSAELDALKHWTTHVDEDHSATSISDESHDYAWEIAKMGEPLPVHAFLASRWRDPTDEELESARKRFAGRGLR
jgi:hypothetical protein